MTMEFDRKSIESWLRVEDKLALESLWRQADETRRTHVGDAIHLRGLVEISNHCVRRCAYCGLNASNRKLARYRMSVDEVVDCALKAREFGCGTLVLQAGEDYGITRAWVLEVIQRIRQKTALAVTLSLGERPDEDLLAWRRAGADRYLLRFETSDLGLYRKIHPPLAGQETDRMRILRELAALGYEVGSGVMIGIPGQTYESLAEDIDTFRRLGLDMIGVGPYIPHPDTRLAHEAASGAVEQCDQVPNNEEMTYKVIALARIVCPDANIPSTTALATLNKKNGRELGLRRGANIVMPNLTPLQYRICYEIYPNKACVFETADGRGECLKARIASIGREIGQGPGGSIKRIQLQEDSDRITEPA
jgi:biotin synthase